MHVTHIIPTLSFGGAERTVVDIINHAHPDFCFSIIVFSSHTSLKDQITRPGVQIIHVPKKGKISWHLVADIKDALQKLNPDLVHTHLFGADVWGRIAARRLNIPVITTEHNINHDEGMFKAIVKRALKSQSKYFVACSKTVQEYIRARYGVRRRVEVIYPGVDEHRFAATPSAFAIPLKIALVGRLVEQKGHQLALQALSSLDPDLWELSIVGDGPLKASLQGWCKKFGIEQKVTFMPPTPKIEQVYARHDIVLVPSRWEGLGIVVLEAMMSGRFVIASRVDGLEEIIEHQKVGLLCEPTPAAFKQAVEWCVEHAEQARYMAQAGQAFARGHFGVEKMVHNYESVYRKIARL